MRLEHEDLTFILISAWTESLANMLHGEEDFCVLTHVYTV